MPNNAILLISCPDQKGIVAKISQFLFEHGGNIEHADQHIDVQTKTFFMRIQWSLDGFTITKENIAKVFTPFAQEFKMDWSLHFGSQVPKVAIFVSKQLHCLYDLLARYQQQELPCQIAAVVSNHRDAENVALHFKIPFYFFDKNAKNKVEVEKQELKLLQEKEVDLVLLARYMQIFTAQFVKALPNRIINIHHSFLPAFVGKDPYQQAYCKGVKIIGATSHYLVEEVDAGPIIEQDTKRISHRYSLEELREKGQDLEKVVLSRAARWHLERKILTYNNKTVVFD